MKLQNPFAFPILLITLIAPSFSLPVTVEKKTVPLDEVERTILCEVYSPDFPNGDCNYHNLIAASDGFLYFTLGTHAPGYATRFYRFDPKTEEMTLVAEVDKAIGEDAEKVISEGKIHTRFFEDDGKLWFASHTSFYEGGLPGLDYDGRKPHQGGRFMSYDLGSGEFQSLANVLPSEGIISMTMDRENDILYGITWPSGLLMSYSVPDDDLRTWGAVQNRGEWGHHPWDWDRICRTLAIDPKGYVYGSTMDGEIWKYDREENRRISSIEGLDLSKVVFTQSAEETSKGDFQNNWRAIEWNPETKTFWGILFETTTLFEFDPVNKYLRSVTDLRPEAYQGMPRNPETSQLGFMIGPKNTIYYLCHGPAIEMEGKPNVQSAVYLLTYEIDKERLTNHGALLTEDQRRPFFTESIAIGPDDHLYTVAWVEVTDPDRKTALLEARKSTGPAETEKMVYEMMLVRLPAWSEFVE